MNLQSIYNATYNYFAEEVLWPEIIPYNPEWELCLNQKIKIAFLAGKRDGLMYKNKKQLNSIKQNKKTKKKKLK